MTNTYTKEYNKFYDAVVKALWNDDKLELMIRERRDGRWFEDIINELTEKGII